MVSGRCVNIEVRLKLCYCIYISLGEFSGIVRRVGVSFLNGKFLNVYLVLVVLWGVKFLFMECEGEVREWNYLLILLKVFNRSRE